MDQTIYKVKAGSFEGPLEVLLSLIEKRKLFINEISLATITDDYIHFIKEIENKGIQHYSDFISVAATLILIKSKSLLPGMTLTEEEEHQIGDLEARLNLYKIIQDVGQEIAKNFGKQIIFPRIEKKIETRVFSPDESITKENMRALMNDVFAYVPPAPEKLREIEVIKVKSIKEMIEDITERVTKNFEKMNFTDLWKGQTFANKKEEKVTVIVSFLAMLELVRQGLMDAFQDDAGEISLEKQEGRVETDVEDDNLDSTDGE